MTPEEKQLIQLEKAYQNVFLGSAEGQLVFWDIINMCYVFKSFNVQNASAYLLEGKREVGLHLMRKVELVDARHGGPIPAEIEVIRQSLTRTASIKYKDEKED